MSNDAKLPGSEPEAERTAAQAATDLDTADVFGPEPTLFNELRDGSKQLRDQRELESVQRDLNPEDGKVIYRLIERVGGGGMGVVYKAEQRSPIRRTVAVKVIKPGFDSAEVIARFESERQALARMDHPNIAKVLGADTDQRGRPFFVMEYVPGTPITKYADENRLSIQQRLDLMMQVCNAITHAHSKAIMHRDIKAGNVLAHTTPDGPMVKVIDFGVAKALTSDRLTDHTFNTARGQAIGTYESMSPEQAEGSPDIDTRTDVYSLGVLLYELLSGTKPFERAELAKAADGEIRRMIRETVPQRPSTRLSGLDEKVVSTIAAARQQQIESLTRELRSELEWIPMMALRKERERRYASPLQMAEDIQNYLSNRPLRAAPESRVYRLRKMLRRNQNGVITAAVFAVALAAGVVIYLHKSHAYELKLLAERNETAHQLAKATALEKSLQLVLGLGSPSDQAFWDQLDSGNSAATLNQTEMVGLLGDYLGKKGKDSVASPLLRYLFETTYAANPNSPAAVHGFSALFGQFMYRSDSKDAGSVLDRVGGLAWAQRILGNTDATVAGIARNNALLLDAEKKPDAAEQLYLHTIAEMEADPHSNMHERLLLHDYLAHFYGTHGQLAKAIVMYRELVNDAKPIPEEQHDMLGMWTSLLGQALLKEGTPADLKEAEPLFHESARLQDALMKSTSIERNNIIIPLAKLLDREHRYTEAAPYWQQAVATARLAEIGNAQRWHAFARYAESLRKQGRGADAAAVLDQENSDLVSGGADSVLLSQVHHEWEEMWAVDAAAEEERRKQMITN